MQENKDFLFSQENKQLKEKIQYLEYLVELYQKKEKYHNELREALEERVQYFE